MGMLLVREVAELQGAHKSNGRLETNTSVNVGRICGMKALF